ncbi:hypothetical protein YC2023_019200 [Brassica napus]
MLLRNPPSVFTDWVDLHSSLLLACYVFGLQKHQEVYIKLYSGLKPQSASFLTNGHQNLNRSSVAGSTRVCNPGISQCSSFGIGLPLNVLGSLALWFDQRFAMPLLRIALQSPAGAARGQLIFKDLSRLKRFNSEEAIEYRLIIVRPLHIKDDAPLQDES